MTDNSYGVFEGPHVFAKDKDSGEIGPAAYCPLHWFAPVSPKLMIVLRTHLFPNPLEDADKKVKKWRESMRKIVFDQVYGEETKGLLDDLPVTMARNSYSEVIDGRICMTEDIRTLGRKKHHKFYFTIFPIGSHHVNTINSVFLDNTSMCTSIVFKDQSTFAKTLEWYLTASCTIGKKVILGWEEDARNAMLNRLEAVSRALGSQQATVRMNLDVDTEFDLEGSRINILEMRRFLHKTGAHKEENRKPKVKSDFIQIYESLGG